MPQKGMPRLTKRSMPWLIATLTGAILGSAGCASVQWNYDYNAARKLANEQHRPMLLYFVDWLSPARTKMDLEVFADPQVVAEMQDTINVFIQYNWFEDLAKNYKISIIPTCVLTGPAGTELSRITGVPAPAEYLAWLRKAKGAAAPAAGTRPLAPPASKTPLTLPKATP